MTLKEALEIVTTATESGTLDDSILGEVDFSEVLTELTAMNSAALSALAIGEDADANEEALRDTMQLTALRCLLAGLLLGRAEAAEDTTISIEVPTGDLADIAVEMLRNGAVSFRLVGA